MAPYPSDETVALFKDFTSCQDNATTIKFLQGANNVLDAAVNNYFENPGRYDQVYNVRDVVEGGSHRQAYQGYDESAFGQSRYGNQEGELPSFQIDSIDNANVYSNFARSNAPTRPNSRNSNSSMRVLTDIQESGVVGDSEARFGPAIRDFYDNSQWAMTVPDTHAAEIYPDVELCDLMRQPEEPVFLKPQNSTNRLPSLLSIIGRIPLVQKDVLPGLPQLDDYGSCASWWSGTSIQGAVADSMEETEASVDAVEFLAELQRLVVFLHASERLYGSVEPLQYTRLMNTNYSTEYGVSIKTEAARFLRAHTIATTGGPSDEASASLFQSVVVHDGMDIAFEELAVSLHQISSPISLYEAVDRLIWESDPDGDAEETRFLSKLAPVLVLNLQNLDTSQWELNVNVPGEWYLDRYMAENKDATKQMRKSRAQCRQAIHNNEEQVKSLRSFRAGENGTVYPLDHILQGAVSYLVSEEGEPEDGSDDEFVQDQEEREECRALSNRVQAAFGQLRETIQTLESEKLELEHALEELSKVFQPSDNEQGRESQLKYKYILRGVSTKANNVYVPTSTGSSGEEEWWKMEYEPTPTVERRTLSLDDVLENANREGREVMLVYASERACQTQDLVIPDALLDFVKNDNLIFKETREASAAAPWPDTAPDYATEPPPYEDTGMELSEPAVADAPPCDRWDADPSWVDQESSFDYSEEMRRAPYVSAAPSRPDETK